MKICEILKISFEKKKSKNSINASRAKQTLHNTKIEDINVHVGKDGNGDTDGTKPKKQIMGKIPQNFKQNVTSHPQSIKNTIMPCQCPCCSRHLHFLVHLLCRKNRQWQEGQ